ncbi:hypothetical protein NBZ79_17380 [Sneathiella marina]|uniref:POTRA domain-containing protein n=1 Tax=Sneathiella marina TaxID=2950108 RepID=A0ABY4W1I6_9PROT|nr:hypothetical protein [Sneathiella marina]USG60933.1 hypothetical protein NBZ79_17380 [Sneathiella marina]
MRSNNTQDERYAVFLAILLMACSFAFLFSLHFAPGKDSREVAVVFNPTLSAGDIVRQLAPLEIKFQRIGAIESIMVLNLTHSNQIEKIYDVGAWLVLDAIFAGGCLTSTRKNNTTMIGNT